MLYVGLNYLVSWYYYSYLIKRCQETLSSLNQGLSFFPKYVGILLAEKMATMNHFFYIGMFMGWGWKITTINYSLVTNIFAR